MTEEDGRSPSAEFASLFRENADAGGVMDFAGFMNLALYGPGVGYYRRDHARVGRGRGTDFFTASTMGPVFGELVAAACADLLGDCDPEEFTFVEIGAERAGGSRGGVLEGASHRFGEARALGIGDLFELGGRCVVFSNELFDAQPFHRFVFRGGAWRELGVRLDGEALVEVELPRPTPAPLPPCAPEGYVFDAPLGAVELLERVVVQPWSGLLVACDYGKSWDELSLEAPAGTARAYHRHAQSNDLLARPGRQDLTCHVCWDWLSTALERNGFEAPLIESQEAFFVRHAGDCISTAIAADAARFSRRKAALLELLHPVHLGQKFQVLHGSRGIDAREAV